LTDDEYLGVINRDFVEGDTGKLEGTYSTADRAIRSSSGYTSTYSSAGDCATVRRHVVEKRVLTLENDIAVREITLLHTSVREHITRSSATMMHADAAKMGQKRQVTNQPSLRGSTGSLPQWFEEITTS
jgi:hypothetical protein